MGRRQIGKAGPGLRVRGLAPQSIQLMKAKVAILLLLLVAVGLGVALVKLNQTIEQERATSATFKANWGNSSNEAVSLRGELNESKTVNLTLETNLNQRFSELTTISNDLASTIATLDKTRVDAAAAAARAAGLSAAEIAKRDEQIGKLTTDRDDLSKEVNDLKGAITKLDTQIQETQRMLASSEGERTFLVKELARLQKEKAELERQFNDLVVLREQVKKLKDQLSVAKRLEWLRMGIYERRDMKGGQLLTQGVRPKDPGTNDSSLKVDLKQSGEVKVQGGTTNAPAPK